MCCKSLETTVQLSTDLLFDSWICQISPLLKISVSQKFIFNLCRNSMYPESVSTSKRDLWIGCQRIRSWSLVFLTANTRWPCGLFLLPAFKLNYKKKKKKHPLVFLMIVNTISFLSQVKLIAAGSKLHNCILCMRATHSPTWHEGFFVVNIYLYRGKKKPDNNSKVTLHPVAVTF